MEKILRILIEAVLINEYGYDNALWGVMACVVLRINCVVHQINCILQISCVVFQINFVVHQINSVVLQINFVLNCVV
jgi:hypothetical protein